MKATDINKKGKKEKGQKVKAGDCIFPFKYQWKEHNECVETEKGEICATSVSDRGTLKTYGYCEKPHSKLSSKQSKSKSKSKSSSISQLSISSKSSTSKSKSKSKSKQSLKKGTEKKALNNMFACIFFFIFLALFCFSFIILF